MAYCKLLRKLPKYNRRIKLDLRNVLSAKDWDDGWVEGVYYPNLRDDCSCLKSVSEMSSKLVGLENKCNSNEQYCRRNK